MRSMIRESIRLFITTLTLTLTIFAQDAKEEFLTAARKGDIEKVKAMLAQGIDVNTRSKYNATALSFACDRGNVELVRLLLEKGADPNATDSFYGATPIVWAAQKGNVQIVKMLLEKGATGKEQVVIGSAREGNAEMVKMLLELGNLTDETLGDALKQAKNGKHAAIIEMLEKAGAKPPPEPNFTVDADTLKTYVGSYKSEQGGEIVFSLSEGKLLARAGTQPSFQVKAYDKTTFAVVEVDATIKFNIEDGKVVGMTLKQAGQTFLFKRVEPK